MSQKPGVILKCVVVGGGLAGLAAAYALRRAGHDVLVFEKRKEKPQNEAVVVSPPNMTKILREWGLWERMLETGKRNASIPFRSAQDGTFIGALTPNVFDAIQKDCNGDFILMQYTDFYNLLYGASLEEQVNIRFGAKVTRLEGCQSHTKVYLDSQEVVEADVVIAADGPNSAIRRDVVANTSGSQADVEEKILLLKAVISLEEMHNEAQLQASTSESSVAWDMYLGDGFFCYGCAPAKDYILVCDLPWSVFEESQVYSDSWVTAEKIPPRLEKFISEEMSAQLQHIIRKARSITLRVLEGHAVPDNLICTATRTVLAGEAAHTATRTGYHSTAVAVEDALTLGYLFSRIQNKGQISGFLHAYDDIRHSRAVQIYNMEIGRQGVFVATKGPTQEARDQLIRTVYELAQNGEVNGELLTRGWGDHIKVIMYDAAEKAEDWWLQLGPSVVKSPVRSRLSVSMMSHTSEETLDSS